MKIKTESWKDIGVYPTWWWRYYRKAQRRRTERIKFSEYEKAGVLEYWIVDPSQKVVEIYVLDGKSYKIMDKWGIGETITSKVLDGFQASVNDIFG
jgi:Uma2 family endonuclease